MTLCKRRWSRTLILATIGLGAVFYAHSCTYDPVPAVKPTKSNTQLNAEQFIDPETARVIITTSKRPRTMLAIAATESGKAGPNITGDGGDSIGVFQIQPHIWGEFGDALEDQVRKADEVFDILVETYGYHEAVKRWNGKGKQASRYRQKVYKIMAQL